MASASRNIFSYDEQFITFNANSKKSQFDVYLHQNWDDKMRSGIFISGIEDIKLRHFDSDHHRMLFQVNPTRQRITAGDRQIKEIDEREVLFYLRPLHWEYSEDSGQASHALIINKRPFQYCSSYLIPTLEKKTPPYHRMLTFDGLKLAIETMLLSSDNGIRMAYNNPHDGEEVLRSHFHLYYVNATLPVEDTPLLPFAGKCQIFENYPAEGFVFDLEETDDIDGTAANVLMLIYYFYHKSLAHNIFLTRVQSSGSKVKLRICVWARELYYEGFDNTIITLDSWKLAGHLMFDDQISFMEDGYSIDNFFNGACHDVFEHVKDDVKNLFS